MVSYHLLQTGGDEFFSKTDHETMKRPASCIGALCRRVSCKKMRAEQGHPSPSILNDPGVPRTLSAVGSLRSVPGLLAAVDQIPALSCRF